MGEADQPRCASGAGGPGPVGVRPQPAGRPLARPRGKSPDSASVGGVPRLQDVAVLAGVSRSTASNVLNHLDQVAPPTRKQVESAIAELGFVRDEAARELRTAAGPNGRDINGRSPAVSMAEVAAAAGVSIGTVSNVVNYPNLVKAATRQRVEDVIEQLGWVANESARRLRKRRR